MLILLWCLFDNITYAGKAEWGLLERHSMKAVPQPSMASWSSHPGKSPGSGGDGEDAPGVSGACTGLRHQRCTARCCAPNPHSQGPSVLGWNDVPKVTRTASDQSGLTQQPGLRTYPGTTLHLLPARNRKEDEWKCDRQTDRQENRSPRSQETNVSSEYFLILLHMASFPPSLPPPSWCPSHSPRQHHPLSPLQRKSSWFLTSVSSQPLKISHLFG